MRKALIISLLLFVAIILWIANVMNAEEINRHNWKSVEDMEAEMAKHRGRRHKG